MDIERLIHSVHNQTTIWDKSTKEYCDRVLKEASWITVGAELFGDRWAEMTEEEKEKKVKYIKNKWRHIRDNFFRSIQPGKPGGPPRQKKKYIYADVLSFLIPSLRKRKRSENKEISDDGENTQDIYTQDGENTQIQNEEEVEIDNTPVFVPEVQPRTHAPQAEAPIKNPGPRKSKEITHFQNQLLKELRASKPEADDPDKYFLLSVLPDMKKLNDEEKLEFRLHTLQFFQNLRRTNAYQPVHHHNMDNDHVLEYDTPAQFTCPTNYPLKLSPSTSSTSLPSPTASQHSARSESKYF